MARARAKVSAVLADAGIAPADIESRLLLEGATSFSSLDLLVRGDELLGDQRLAHLRSFLERRLRHEPMTRILGHNGFYGLDLIVTPDVLDPRTDTETLVDAALTFLRKQNLSRPLILDLGTGSGAILCALLSSEPHALGYGVDISEAACKVARINLARCDLTERSAILCGNWADSIKGRFDLVVANPPYISLAESAALAPEVAEHDPALALFGGEDGLDSYRHIAGDIDRLLKPGGKAFFEIGWRQAESVISIFSLIGFRDIFVSKDHCGCDRVVTARKI